MRTVFYPTASTPAANLRDIAHLNASNDDDWTLPLVLKWAKDLVCDAEVFEAGSARADWWFIAATGELTERGTGVIA